MASDPLRPLLPFPAVVFDLDGTLVRLQVDWLRVRLEMAERAAALGLEGGDRTVWGMLRAADGTAREALEAVLRRHEREGALQAVRLPAADLLPRLGERRRGVVTLNSRQAARLALERTDLADQVDALVAREDVLALKPDPAPLLRCLSLLGATPGGAVFVGDRERDRVTAERAGTAYLSVQDLALDSGSA